VYILCSKDWECNKQELHVYGVIILELLIFVLNQSFMQGLSTLKWVITLFVKGWLRSFWIFVYTIRRSISGWIYKITFY
jgi:hypothetical protein